MSQCFGDRPCDAIIKEWINENEFKRDKTCRYINKWRVIIQRTSIW